MQLSLMTWPEVEARLNSGVCALLPIGSTEQHGPMGLIGTDAICANEVALAAAKLCDAIVVPEIAYTPAPFNTAFPGTISVTAELTQELVWQVCIGLLDQGFKGVFILNGHGANLDPIQKAIALLPKGAVKVQSWWAPAEVKALRDAEFGEWEGMHATPSEVAITQALHGSKPSNGASEPPKKLSSMYLRAHAGDRHGPPDEHRAAFPDGRVGSHSALATPEIGAKLMDAAARAIASEFAAFCNQRCNRVS
ncbi:MAG: creatininase family protein [Ruegeria sp.]